MDTKITVKDEILEKELCLPSYKRNKCNIIGHQQKNKQQILSMEKKIGLVVEKSDASQVVIKANDR